MEVNTPIARFIKMSISILLVFIGIPEYINMFIDKALSPPIPAPLVTADLIELAPPIFEYTKAYIMEANKQPNVISIIFLSPLLG